MLALCNKVVEKEIINAVEEVLSILKIEAEIDSGCSPSAMGISSQILITIMGQLETKLGVIIPDNCYIFFNNGSHTQLTIKEAAEKLIKIAKEDGK